MPKKTKAKQGLVLSPEEKALVLRALELLYRNTIIGEEMVKIQALTEKVKKYE
jgi:hypothetical protein